MPQIMTVHCSYKSRRRSAGQCQLNFNFAGKLQQLTHHGRLRESIQKNLTQWKAHRLHGQTRLCRPLGSCRSHRRSCRSRQWLSQGSQSFLPGTVHTVHCLANYASVSRLTVVEQNANRQVIVTLRYGREDDEVMGVKFSKEMVLISEQVVPTKSNREQKLSTLQVKISLKSHFRKSKILDFNSKMI